MTQITIPCARVVFAIVASALLVACASDPSQRIAGKGGLLPLRVHGEGFLHRAYVRIPPRHGDTLLLFLEGDGRPWNASGRAPSDDPTPENPLALRLAVQTPGLVAYLGRPCYFIRHEDPACRPAIWTDQRNSDAVVRSLVAATNALVARTKARRLVLIGYSGGGALAVLMAPRLPGVTAVITLAADLDTAAWTDDHHYEPLRGSLNPAQQPALDPSIRQLHLVGDRDRNVPFRLNARYFARLPADSVRHYPTFDHVCCWVEHWPTLLKMLPRE